MNIPPTHDKNSLFYYSQETDTQTNPYNTLQWGICVPTTVS